MKLVNYIISALCALAVLTACENDDNTQNDNKPTPPAKEQSFIGTIKVDQNDGSIFEKEGVEVEYKLNNEISMDIVMHKVKFAEAMPIELDMTIPGVSYLITDKYYGVSGDNIIPLAMGGEFPQFTITDMTGVISDKTMELTFMCGEYYVEYTATVK